MKKVGEPYLFGSSWCNNYDLATHSQDLLENRDEKSIIILHFISSKKDESFTYIEKKYFGSTQWNFYSKIPNHSWTQ